MEKLRSKQKVAPDQVTREQADLMERLRQRDSALQRMQKQKQEMEQTLKSMKSNTRSIQRLMAEIQEMKTQCDVLKRSKEQSERELRGRIDEKTKEIHAMSRQLRQQLRQIGHQSVHHRVLHVQHRENTPEFCRSARTRILTGRLRRHEDVGVLRELQHDSEEVVQTAHQRVHAHVEKGNETVANDGQRLGVCARHQPGESLRVIGEERGDVQVVVHVHQKGVRHRVDGETHAIHAMVHDLLVGTLEELEEHRNERVQRVVHRRGVQLVDVVLHHLTQTTECRDDVVLVVALQHLHQRGHQLRPRLQTRYGDELGDQHSRRVADLLIRVDQRGQNGAADIRFLLRRNVVEEELQTRFQRESRDDTHIGLEIRLVPVCEDKHNVTQKLRVAFRLLQLLHP